jgi:hypothetical protein
VSNNLFNFCHGVIILETASPPSRGNPREASLTMSGRSLFGRGLICRRKPSLAKWGAVDRPT